MAEHLLDATYSVDARIKKLTEWVEGEVKKFQESLALNHETAIEVEGGMIIDGHFANI